MAHAIFALAWPDREPPKIEPVPTSAFPTPAKRPGNSRMNTGKLRRTFGVTLPDWRTGVERMLVEMLGR